MIIRWLELELNQTFQVVHLFTEKIHILSCFHTKDSEVMVNSVMAQSFITDSFLLLLIVSSAGMNHQPHMKSSSVHTTKLKSLKNKKLISSKT